MEYTVKALAELAGVTPRTLRWYDQVGLLKPLRTTEAGYRLYGPAQLDRLQDILFYRGLGLDLAAIQAILDDPAFDRQAALQSHLTELKARRTRLDDLILTVQRTLDDLKGGTKMTDQEKFEAFKRHVVEANEAAFGREIRQKYGDEEADRANACVLALTQEEYRAWKSLGGEIHTALTAAVRVVVRVHNRTADSRTNTHVTFSTSLTDIDQVVVAVANYTDSSAAADRNHSHLSGR